MYCKVIFILFWSAVTISQVSASTTIPGGNVSGSWTAAGSPYEVEGHIAIPADQTLNIEPGVEVAFQSSYAFDVYGYLQALGTEADSIQIHGLYGFLFSNSPDSSHLAYCAISGGVTWQGGIYCVNSNPVITHSRISGFDNPVGWGAGIVLSNSNPEISYCSITGNSSWSHGGGIYCSNSDPVISHCDISGNSAGTYGGYGGGIYASGGCNITVSNCTINDNYADDGGGIGFYGGVGTISDCVISGDSTNASGGGIYIQSTSADFTITNTTISNCNAGSEGGGGIFIHTVGTLTMVGCTIDDNFAYSVWGIAMHIDNCDSLIMDHCNILNNRGGISESGLAFYSNTHFILTNSIFKGQSNGDVYFHNADYASVAYNDFYSNYPFYGDVPPGLGTLMQINANGDSCDVFSNIYLDPLFVDFPGGDYHLTEASPCIDAGDPAYPLDPDGTTADMGTFYFDQTTALDPAQNVTIEVNGTDVTLQWDPVSGANSYKVYCSDYPYSDFVEDNSGSFDGESWISPLAGARKCYYVTASTEVIR
jgi:hypothetical protein